ncbi:hypothetical protein BTZ20_0517 [Rhodococcus sp. MTM3W5.2]|nr:hypothetical protein [Rhodococcus sp. MTM3W5.2]AQA25527.1 hypothetical protein BTZ20_0517 [Rhodococcus sp. MTM3W5.2]
MPRVRNEQNVRAGGLEARVSGTAMRTAAFTAAAEGAVALRHLKH